MGSSSADRSARLLYHRGDPCLLGTDEQQPAKQNFLEKPIAILLGLPWAEVFKKTWEAVQNAMQCRSQEGIYEVLEYESTLNLQDRVRKRATFCKREKVRYLQDHIIAYQDQAWGDGEILLNYRCTPGKAVDRYRLQTRPTGPPVAAIGGAYRHPGQTTHQTFGTTEVTIMLSIVERDYVTFSYLVVRHKTHDDYSDA